MRTRAHGQPITPTKQTKEGADIQTNERTSDPPYSPPYLLLYPCLHGCRQQHILIPLRHNSYITGSICALMQEACTASDWYCVHVYVKIIPYIFITHCTTTQPQQQHYAQEIQQLQCQSHSHLAIIAALLHLTYDATA